MMLFKNIFYQETPSKKGSSVAVTAVVFELRVELKHGINQKIYQIGLEYKEKNSLYKLYFEDNISLLYSPIVLLMNLFINAVSSQWKLIIFDDTRNIIGSQNIEIAGNESSRLSGMLKIFLQEHGVDYSDITNIVVVHGPGSFTWVRTICLMVNTIAFSVGCSLTPVSYFDLFSDPIVVKQSSKRDVFLYHSESGVSIVSNQECREYCAQHQITQLSGEAGSIQDIEIIENIDYCDIIEHVVLQEQTSIAPLYIKKPNIC